MKQFYVNELFASWRLCLERCHLMEVFMSKTFLTPDQPIYPLLFLHAIALSPLGPRKGDYCLLSLSALRQPETRLAL